jgi:hypothetical protein
MWEQEPQPVNNTSFKQVKSRIAITLKTIKHGRKKSKKTLEDRKTSHIHGLVELIF